MYVMHDHNGIIVANANINFKDAFWRSSECFRPSSDLSTRVNKVSNIRFVRVYHDSRLYDRHLTAILFMPFFP